MDDLLAQIFVRCVDAGVCADMRRVLCCLSVLAEGYERKHQRGGTSFLSYTHKSNRQEIRDSTAGVRRD